MQPHPWDSPPGKNTGVGCRFLLQCIKVKSESEAAQSCLTLRLHGLYPTRLLRPWDFPGKRTGVGCHCLSGLLVHTLEMWEFGRVRLGPKSCSCFWRLLLETGWVGGDEPLCGERALLHPQRPPNRALNPPPTRAIGARLQLGQTGPRFLAPLVDTARALPRNPQGFCRPQASLQAFQESSC